MNTTEVTILNIEYRRPGISKVHFRAVYRGHTRTETMLYDTVDHKFLSHNNEIKLLAAICESIQTTKVSQTYE